MDDLQALHEALSSYVERASEKLRKDGLRAEVMEVYGMSNRFHKADFYYNTATFRFPVSTSDSSERIKGAFAAFETVYRENIPFKKLGLHLREITREKPEQTLLFDKIDRDQSCALMKALDDVNSKMETRTINYASSGLSQPKRWRTEFNLKSPAYTTRWDELLRVL
nr:DUF4113 domain-containing protein [Desulfoluna limicola]